MSFVFRVWRLALVLFVLPLSVLAASLEDFVGTFNGQAEITADGKTERRDMSVTISKEGKGVRIDWTSVIYRADGRTKQGSYSIDFVPSPRDNIYASAMKTNVFGKTVPLDPLNGEPYVWARLDGSTLSVFSLFINQAGEYEIQEYHRTLVEGGLDLVFRRVRDAGMQREIRTFLKRED